MRHLFTLVTVALLGMVPLGGAPVSAQEQQGSEAWLGVALPESGAPTEQLESFLSFVDLQLSAYEVGFEQQHAFVPEIKNAEFMVVVVESGGFVLHAMNTSSLIVDQGGGSQIRYVEHDGVVTVGEDITYMSTMRPITDANGKPCSNMCTLLPDEAVLLTASNRAIAPAGSICVWCLLNGNDGTLLVYPLLRDGEDFSWITQYGTVWSAAPSTSNNLERSVPEESAPVTMAWAMFNPSGNCRGN